MGPLHSQSQPLFRQGISPVVASPSVSGRWQLASPNDIFGAQLGGLCLIAVIQVSVSKLYKLWCDVSAVQKVLICNTHLPDNCFLQSSVAVNHAIGN